MPFGRLIFTLLLLGCGQTRDTAQASSTPGDEMSTAISPAISVAEASIRAGADQADVWLPLLKGRRIGLVVNQTSMVGARHLVDTLQALDLNIQAIFAPEHGFRGTADAGATISDGRDERSGLEVFSLYGANKKPSAEQLASLDVLVFDIQDVGARFYTYISTLHYVMEACAEQNVRLVVLDRPNPNGHYTDGPVLDPDFRSFVGMHPIPLIHGMTIGELAQMINGEGWLGSGKKAPLTVVPCTGWTHSTPYRLPIPPSPNLPTQRSVYLYPSLCLFEGTVVSVGRGTPWPFEVIGHPDFEIGSFQFTPSPGPGSAQPLLQGQQCLGTSFQGIAEAELREMARLNLGPLLSYHEFLHQKTSFFLANGFFDKLAGTDQLRKQIQSGMNEDEIRATWKPALDKFRIDRRPYMLYP